GLELVGGFGREPWRLVNVHADAMAEAVAEMFAVARALDHVPGDPVGLDAGHSRIDPVDRLRLCLEADVVDLPQLLGDAAGLERAGAVGAVTLELRPPVDRHE